MLDITDHEMGFYWIKLAHFEYRIEKQYIEQDQIIETGLTTAYYL
ncbi:hypothetical protein VCRA2119O124_560004 [Vibrio crassostreae]|nr:hypothetical protein VCRA2119O124_560004 [Vibrio crassostreae]